MSTTRNPCPPIIRCAVYPNTVLTPHLGYGSQEVYRVFYGESIENVLAFMDGKPIRVLNNPAG